MKSAKSSSESGFSLAELLVVLGLTAVMTSVSLYYLYSHQKLYKADEEAANIIDLLQEARQRALTQKVTMRFEIDLTSNAARLIDEGNATISSDDKIIRQISLQQVQDIVVERRPNNISTNPTEPSPVDPIVFIGIGTHPISLNHKVATLRFRKDGTVTDAGTNDLAANATVTGATIFVWQPNKANANNSIITRAITVIGSSGAIRLWNYYPSQPANSAWRDSRRFQ